MNRRPERIGDLLPGVLAELAARHHATNGAPAVIRVHLKADISMKPRDFPNGSDWEATDAGELQVYSGPDTVLAEFAPDTWTYVERVQDGAA